MKKNTINCINMVLPRRGSISWIAPLLLLIAGGCSDFLKEESQDEVIPKTTIDFRELLMGSGYYPNQEPAAFVYYLDDDVEFNMEYNNGSFVGSITANASFPAFTWQPTFVDRDGNGVEIAEDPSATPYARYYTWIKGCNAVLDHIDDAIGTQLERDQVKAEALALRALYYFKLVNLYGDPVSENPDGPAVPLKLHADIEETYTPRATVRDVYRQIVEDLAEAVRLMEPMPYITGDYHINLPAMQLLLSRVYLYLEDWKATIDAANEALEKGNPLWDMTQLTGTYQLNYQHPEVVWRYGGRTQPEQSVYKPSNEFLATFDPQDMRFVHGFSLVNGGYYLVTKLPGGAELGQVLRTSEALLNRAEARAHLGQIGDALTDLNTLRRHRIVGYTDLESSDPAVVLEAIRAERRKEFCYEGFRWFDLKRYGRPSIEHRYQHAPGEPALVYVLEEKDAMWTLPLPNTLLLRNPALEQNPSAFMGPRVGRP